MTGIILSKFQEDSLMQLGDWISLGTIHSGYSNRWMACKQQKFNSHSSGFGEVQNQDSSPLSGERFLSNSQTVPLSYILTQQNEEEGLPRASVLRVLIPLMTWSLSKDSNTKTLGLTTLHKRVVELNTSIF